MVLEFAFDFNKWKKLSFYNAGIETLEQVVKYVESL